MTCAIRSLWRIAGILPLATLFALVTGRTIAADQSDPPRLLFAEHRAILILIDGDPVYRPVKGTDLERIVNTKPFIVRDTAGIHYMKVYDGWMEAYGFRGMWSVAGVPPPGAEQAFRRTAAARTVALVDAATARPSGRRPTLDDATAPAIFVSTEPAELIVTSGPPRFVTVEGTSLEYVENTTANIFKEPTDEELYVLISGRWLRAWTTDGPWEVVSRSDLPSDILDIPDSSPIWHGTRAARATPRR
jgi:hypothetical protein